MTGSRTRHPGAPADRAGLRELELDAPVRVWCATTDLPAPEVDAFAHLLAPAETARAAATGSERERSRFVVRRGLLRTLIAGITGSPGAAIATGAHGRPLLADHARGIRFSVAHSGGTAVFAIALDGDTGVDIEQDRNLALEPALLRDTCAPAEIEILCALPAAARDGAFLRLWCRKEAVVKGIGLGIGMDLRTVDVRGPACRVTVPGGPPAQWRIADIDAIAGFHAAVAWREA